MNASERSSNESVEERVRQLCAWYGEGVDGSCPTPDQWRNVLGRDPEKSVSLLNLFKFRETADYGGGEERISGADAFNRYAAVSMPTLAKVGGQFVHAGPFEGTFCGGTEDWDLLVVAAYPDVEAFWRLYSDAEYRAAYDHRRAACERQSVMVTSQ